MRAKTIPFKAVSAIHFPYQVLHNGDLPASVREELIYTIMDKFGVFPIRLGKPFALLTSPRKITVYIDVWNGGEEWGEVVVPVAVYATKAIYGPSMKVYLKRMNAKMHKKGHENRTQT